MAAGQPSGISKPLIDFGFIGFGVFLGLRHVLRRRHAELTQKRGQEPHAPASTSAAHGRAH
ncbi:MAG TPA: hypothetical protein VF384_17265 [Planctomycetota bacterium]